MKNSNYLGEHENCINYSCSPNIIYNNFIFDSTEIETDEELTLNNYINFKEIEDEQND